MKTYTIRRTVLFSEEIEVEANNVDEAIHKAQMTPVDMSRIDFIDTDYYEAVDSE